jgi:hypothetical protein
MRRVEAMPLGAKFRKLRDLRRGPDGEEYSLSEIATEASRLYRELKISKAIQEGEAAGASMEEIERRCEEIRGESDVVNRQYLTDLRDGKKSDIKWGVVEALSEFFQVKTDYWRIGPEANEETRRAEEEVELIALGVQAIKAAKKLDGGDTESDQEGTQGLAMMGALFRGVDGADSEQAKVILRAALLGLQAAQEDQTG